MGEPVNNDAELVHDAYLEVMSDPEKYSDWQYDFVNDLEKKRKAFNFKLSLKQKYQLERILRDD